MTELALVIAIVITMTGLIAPHFRDSWRSSSLTSAVELTATAMNFARQSAIVLRDDVKLTTSSGSRDINIVNLDTGDTLKVFTLPPQTYVEGQGGQMTCYPRGTATGGQIRVTNDEGLFRVRLTPTARVRIIDLT